MGASLRNQSYLPEVACVDAPECFCSICTVVQHSYSNLLLILIREGFCWSKIGAGVYKPDKHTECSVLGPQGGSDEPPKPSLDPPRLLSIVIPKLIAAECWCNNNEYII